MPSGQEMLQPEPTLDDLINRTIIRFNSRRFDQGGSNPYHLDLAVIDMMVETGIDGQALFAIVKPSSSLAPELQQVALDQANEVPPYHRAFTAAGIFIAEEILSKHPELKIENDIRVIMTLRARYR